MLTLVRVGGKQCLASQVQPWLVPKRRHTREEDLPPLSYQIRTHAAARRCTAPGTGTAERDIIDQLVELGRAAFAEYEGAPSMDADAKRWFLSRPGCDPARCFVAVDGETIVANTVVTMREIQLGGELLRCGIVDSVSTHPNHQRRGLAGRLMDTAHKTMQADGLDAALLYTNPGGHAYRFYHKLGYLTRAQLVLVVGARPNGLLPEGVREMRPDESAHVRELVNAGHANHDGFSPIDDALWQWHYVERPPTRPARTRVLDNGEEVTAVATFSDMDVLLDGTPTRLSVAFDVAGPDAIGLLRSAPTETVAILLDERSPHLERCRNMGLQRQVGEAAMVLPFTGRARAALAQPPREWYVMVESVVGV